MVVTRTMSSSAGPSVWFRSAHKPLAPLSGAALSAVRIVVSFLFACHGTKVLFGMFGGMDDHGATAAIGSWPIWWAGIIELGAGALVLLGLFTKPAAVLCSGTMAFAYFTVHQPQGWFPLQNHGELATLYSWIFLLIAVLGPGSFALDTVLRHSLSATASSSRAARITRIVNATVSERFQ
ncbi:MAG TPA: DoxX family protein [Pseudonocardiaceae bacterium]|nr:DoxX family protein [Pseudonocardiaceae bacterium]